MDNSRTFDSFAADDGIDDVDNESDSLDGLWLDKGEHAWDRD